MTDPGAAKALGDTLRDKTVVTRCWWIRHAPVPGFEGRLYDHDHVEADVSNETAFKLLAQRLPKDAVWVVSHMRRAHQTAQAIGAAGYALPALIEDPEVAEMSFGTLAGKAYSDFKDLLAPEDYHKFWMQPAAMRPPEGESFEDLCRRVDRAFARHVRAHAGKDIVFVSHGGTIRAALRTALEIKPDNALTISIENLSTTRIDHVPGEGLDGNFRVVFVNTRPS